MFVLKDVVNFKYLGSMISENSGCKEEVRHRVGAGWGKWLEMSGIVCDKRMPIMLKAVHVLYKNIIRPVLMYGSETWLIWALGKTEHDLLEITNRTEMRMLR